VAALIGVTISMVVFWKKEKVFTSMVLALVAGILLGISLAQMRILCSFKDVREKCNQ
jgi:hypothetical protein